MLGRLVMFMWSANLPSMVKDKTPVHLEVLGEELKPLVLVLLNPHNVVNHLVIIVIYRLNFFSTFPSLSMFTWNSSSKVKGMTGVTHLLMTCPMA